MTIGGNAERVRDLMKGIMTQTGSSSATVPQIDTHGWTQQILTSNPSGVLSQTFHRYFPRNSLNYLGGDGYFTAYTRSLGYDSCLFEFPRDVSSYLDFYTSGYIDKYIGVIWDLLEHY